ncbi:MAG: acyl-ACP--UDP-N-acetylglucosamine O-acyltransferase [Thermoanaerobaculaceae bacterium]
MIGCRPQEATLNAEIHHTAVIEAGAVIGEGCRIGPFCHVGPYVTLGSGNVLHASVVVDGHTTLGDGNEVFPFACLGKISQDLKFDRSWISHTRIGSGNVVREYVTINASSQEGGSTIVGDRCALLSYSHVAHDCVLGDRVVLSSDAKIAGHVELHDGATVSAKTGIVQFVRVGRFAFVGGFNKVAKDILPFCIADGFPSELRAVNRIGLERAGFAPERIAVINAAFRTLVRSALTLDEAVAELAARYADDTDVREMVDFATSSRVGLARPRRQQRNGG